jgi:hypothetical protein
MERTGLLNSISPRQAWLLRPSPDGNLKVEWGTAVADASTACEVRRHEEPAPVSEDWHFARMGFVSEAYPDHGIEVVYGLFSTLSACQELALSSYPSPNLWNDYPERPGADKTEVDALTLGLRFVNADRLTLVALCGDSRPAPARGRALI